MAFRRKKKFIQRSPRRLHKLNNEIKAREVRVVDHNNEMLGVMTFSAALHKAQEKDQDLVLISPSATPPVCKIIDYGKMLYHLKKKEQKNRKITKTQETKGVRLTFKMDIGDLDRQQKLAKKFLEKKQTVRIQMRLRGRERAHTELGIEKLNKFIESLSDISKIETPPKPSGFQIIAILKPL